MSRGTWLVDKIRKGESIPWPISAALSAATPIIRYGMKRRLRLPAERVTAYVISIGNLSITCSNSLLTFPSPAYGYCNLLEGKERPRKILFAADQRGVG